jgi:tRNA modification GTPase
MSTIIAPASGTQRAGVIVVRVSGPKSKNLIEIICRKNAPKARLASFRTLFGLDGDIIDQALVLYFPAPNSFTGEDVVEFQIHGGPTVLAALIDNCLKSGLVEYAKPGEFSKRAFINGKLDLTQAEGLADLIDAETEGQRKQAMRQMQGDLGNLVIQWREEIMDCLAEAEAYIDFPDEDLPSGLSIGNKIKITELRHSLYEHFQDSKNAKRIRDGVNIVIIGSPNVGKSSLLNVLCGKDAAIVSSIAGTTRDIVEVSFVLNGQLISLYDTAGLREASDIIEQEGIKRAIKKSENADLILGLCNSLEDAEILLPHLRHGDYLIDSKSDNIREFEKTAALAQEMGLKYHTLSSKTGEGIEVLLNIIKEFCANENNFDTAPLSRIRQIDSVEKTIKHLDNCLAISDNIPEIACEELRLAVRSLGELIGVVSVDNIYDRIFSSFCIGK